MVYTVNLIDLYDGRIYSSRKFRETKIVISGNKSIIFSNQKQKEKAQDKIVNINPVENIVKFLLQDDERIEGLVQYYRPEILSIAVKDLFDRYQCGEVSRDDFSIALKKINLLEADLTSHVKEKLQEIKDKPTSFVYGDFKRVLELSDSVKTMNEQFNKTPQCK